MDEIKQLQALLQSVQKAEVQQRLSERNCIDLINKLLGLHLISLIYTSDGKEFLTPKQLEREIRDEILARGGRASLVDIQTAINVDLRHIEQKVSELIRDDDTLQLFESQVISKEYFDSVCEDVNQQLQEIGQISISELARRYSLTVQFTEAMLKSRLGSQIQGMIDQGVLFTEMFVKRQQAKVIGVLSACTRPVQLQSILTAHNLSEKLFISVVNDLVANGRVAGTFQQRQWIPDAFGRDQQKAVTRFFNHNGRIEYHHVSKLQIANPKSYLVQKLGDKGVALSSVFVSQTVLVLLEGSLEESLRTNSCLSVASLLSLSVADAEEALKKTLSSMGVKDGYMVVPTDNDLIFVPESIPTKCEELVKAYAKDNGDRLHRLLVMEAQPHSQSHVEEDRGKKASSASASSSSSSSSTAAAKAAKSPPPPDDDSDESDDDRKTKGKKKTEKKMGGRDKHFQQTSKVKKQQQQQIKDKEKEEEEQHKAALEAQGPQRTAAIIKAELASALEPVLGNKCDFDPAIKDILKHRYYSMASKLFLETARSVFATGHKHKLMTMQEPLTMALGNLNLYRRALQQFQLEGGIQSVVERFIQKKFGAEVTAVIFAAAVSQTQGISDEEKNKVLIAQMEQAEARNTAIESLPARMKDTLAALHSQTVSPTKKGLVDFDRVVESAVGAVELQVAAAYDKNKERGVLHVHKQVWTEQLVATKDPGVVIILTLQLLVLHTAKVLLQLPWKAVEAVIETLAITPDTKDLLKSLHTVVCAKRAQADGSGVAREASVNASDAIVDVDTLNEEEMALCEKVRQLTATKQSLAAAASVSQ